MSELRKAIEREMPMEWIIGKDTVQPKREPSLEIVDAILDAVIAALPETPNIPLSSLGEREIGHYSALRTVKSLLLEAKKQ